MTQFIYEIKQNQYNEDYIQRTDTDGLIWFIPKDPANSDYQAYLAYVANGNKAPDTLVTESAPTA